MATEIKVPRLGWSMEEGTFVEWLKRDGQSVKPGEPLFSIEGDKAIQEIESIGSGILRIAPTAPASGETVKVGATLAFLVEPEEAFAFEGMAAAAGRRSEKPERVTPAEAKRRPPSAAAAAPQVGKPRISPRAARLAAELGLDWTNLRGSGKTGRIRERDVQAHASSPHAAAPIDRRAAPEEQSAAPAASQGRPATRPTLRAAIAARMTATARSAVPVTLTTTADATDLVRLRDRFQAAERLAGERPPGYVDVVMKLAARALREHADMNQQWVDDRIVRPQGIHIAFAVDTPVGLVAPVLRDVSDLTLREIAARRTELTRRALDARLTADDLSGGTFTVTNLGPFGIDAFTPILNSPQCAILGLGRIDRRPVVLGEEIVPRDVITLSLTFDHRIVDGAPAAAFLAALRGAVANPAPILLF